MRKDNDQSWQQNKSNTQGVDSLGVGHVGLRLFERSLYQQSVGTRYSAGQIAGPYVRPFFEIEGSKVFARVGSVSKSSRSGCCPSGNFSKLSADIQRVAGVNVFDGAKTNVMSENRIDDDQLVLAQVQVGDDVVGEDQSESQKNNCCTSSARLGFREEESLNKGEAGHDDCEDGNHIAGRRSFHPVIFARKERING